MKIKHNYFTKSYYLKQKTVFYLNFLIYLFYFIYYFIFLKSTYLYLFTPNRYILVS